MVRKQQNIFETGSFTVVLSEGYYQNYFPIRKNQLLKITHLTHNHNEFTYLEEIQKIKNYTKYYGLPTTNPISLFNKHKIMLFLADTLNSDVLEKLKKSSVYFYVNNAGDTELFKTIQNLQRFRTLSFWRSYTDILNFIKQVITALTFLHQRKICHLDIKPENIMVDTKNRKYRLIDFGFASQEPFQDYLKDTKGTPRYFPKYMAEEKFTAYFPRIRADDMIPIEGEIPMKRNPHLVYKIDSYCLGRIIYCLEKLFTEIKPTDCLCGNQKIRRTIMAIRDLLLINQVEKRSYIEDLHEIYFTKKKVNNNKYIRVSLV